MELQDKNLKEILSNSKLELPFSDFEDNMLRKIEEYEIKRKQAEKYKFYGHLCFLIGTVLGMVLNYIVSEKIEELALYQSFYQAVVMLFQLGFIILVIIFADKALKLIDMDLKKIFK